MVPCRKCQAPNPESNQYCRQCGAVLAVSTHMVRAQKSTLKPLTRGFRWRWVALGALVLLGTNTLAVVAVGVLAGSLVARAAAEGSLGALGARAPGMALAALAAFALAFVLGGALTSVLSRLRRTTEPALAALIVLALLGAAGTTLSTDAALLAALAALPSALAAALGGWIGGLAGKGEPTA